jgi:hypothetical protein
VTAAEPVVVDVVFCVSTIVVAVVVRSETTTLFCRLVLSVTFLPAVAPNVPAASKVIAPP